MSDQPHVPDQPYAVSAASINPGPLPALGTKSVSELSQPFVPGVGWMKFIGIIYIIGGALACITIIGIVIAWLPIWMGALLTQSASAIERAHQNNDAAAMKESLARLGTLFVMKGVLIIVGFVAVILAILAAFLFLGHDFINHIAGGHFPH
jgi:hypothetical protein